MATTMNGSARSRAVSAGVPSRSRILDIAVRIVDDPTSLNLNGISLYVGKASSAPATYGDLTTPTQVDDSSDFLSYSYQFQGTGVVLQIRDAMGLTAFTAADHLWLCLFNTLTPSGADAVAAVMDLGILAA